VEGQEVTDKIDLAVNTKEEIKAARIKEKEKG